MGRFSETPRAFRNDSADFFRFSHQIHGRRGESRCCYRNIKRYGNYFGVILSVAKSTGFDLHSAIYPEKYPFYRLAIRSCSTLPRVLLLYAHSRNRRLLNSPGLDVHRPRYRYCRGGGGSHKETYTSHVSFHSSSSEQIQPLLTFCGCSMGQFCGIYFS